MATPAQHGYLLFPRRLADKRYRFYGRHYQGNAGPMIAPDSPNCPVHGTAMRPATHWVRVADKNIPLPCFICGKDGCLQVYDDVRGHRVEPEGAIIGNALSAVATRLRYFGR